MSSRVFIENLFQGLLGSPCLLLNLIGKYSVASLLKVFELLLLIEFLKKVKSKTSGHEINVEFILLPHLTFALVIYFIKSSFSI